MDKRPGAEGTGKLLMMALCLAAGWRAFGEGAANPQSNSPPAAPILIGSGLGDVQIQPGFRVELVAAENLVTAPVAMAFDENGRLFVVENPRAATRASGRIRLLEDTNSDGMFDTSRVFVDKLLWPSAVAAYGGGIFVGATPSIWFFKDSKVRGIADVRKLSFGTAPSANTAMPLARANSFNWALNNSFHGVTGFIDGPPLGPVTGDVLGSEFWFDPRAMTISTVNDGARSGLSFDNAGRVFFCDQSNPLLVQMYERRYVARNPFFAQPPAEIPVLAQTTMRIGGNVSTPEWLERGNPFVIYRGGAFPANYIGNAFIADAAGQTVRRLICQPNGLEVSCMPNPAAADFLVSHDAAFRPVQIMNGPDGTLYVASHRSDDDSGRIYRIVPEYFRGLGKPQLGRAKISGLVATLEKPGGWERDTAERLLYERRDRAAPPLLATMISASKNPQARLQAVYALEGSGLLNEDAVLRALQDENAMVRENGVRLSEEVAVNGDVTDKLWSRLRAMGADPSLRVRYQLAFTLGNIGRPDRTVVLAAILRQDPDNLWIQTAVLSSLADGAGGLYLALVNDAKFAASPIGADFLHRLLIMIGTQGRMASLGQILSYVDTMSADSLRAYGLLYDLGEGLRRENSSLPLADPQGRMQRFYGEAFKIAASARADDAPRIAALKLLAVSPVTYGQTADLLLLLLGTGQSDAAQAAVVEALGRFSDPRISRAVIQRWSALPPSVRQAAVTALLSRSERVPDIAAAIEQGAIARTDLTLMQIDYLRTYRDPTISARAVQLFGPMTTTRPDVMKRFAPALKMNGSAAEGRRVFEARCAICHGPQGTGVGPNLQSVRHWTRQKILEAIVEPNTEIAPDYSVAVVDTVVGETFIGVLVNSNDAAITLRLVNGDTVILPRINIQAIRRQEWSLMPEGLESGLTMQNMADLLEYVASISR